MAGWVKFYCWRLSKLSLKITLVLLVLVLGLVAAFVMRVSHSPLEVTFAKHYLQSAMHDRETESQAVFDRAFLYWPDLKGALFLQIRDAHVMNKDGVPLLSINTASLSFSRAGLFVGRILPKAIILEKPVMRLIREEDGAFGFDFGPNRLDDGSTVEQRQMTTRIFGYIARPGYESTYDSTISRLQSLKIQEAQLIVEDRAAAQTRSFPNFNSHFFSTQQGMKGEVRVDLPDFGLKSASMTLDMEYLWDQKDVVLSSSFKNISTQALVEQIPELDILRDQNVVFDAKLDTILDERFLPSDIRLSFQSQRGDIFHPDLSDEVVAYKALNVEASYNYPGKTLSVQEADITLGDGVHVSAQADITYDEAGVRGPIKVNIDEAEHAHVTALWPKVLEGDDSEKWVVQRMSKGMFKDLWVECDLVAVRQSSEGAPAQWGVGIENLMAGFAVENMDVDYKAPLPPAKNVYGSGRFDFNADELALQIDKGFLGDMTLRPSKLLFDKVVAVGEGGVDIQAGLDAKLQDVLRYISTDPINMGDDLDLDIDAVKGTAVMDVHLNFPTRDDVKLEEFEIGITATLDDVFLPDVVETLDLGGGPYAFSVVDGLVKMNGKGLLENRPIDLEWSRFLKSEGKPYKQHVKAQLTADPNLRAMLGIDLNDFLEGPVDVDVDYTSYRNGSAVADIDVDATQSVFFVTPMDFQKNAGQKATAKMKAQFRDGVLTDIKKLTAQGAMFQLFDSAFFFKEKDGKTVLSHGSVSRFVLEETKAKLDFSYGEQGALALSVDADVFDAKPFLKTDDDKVKQENPAMKINLKAAELKTAPDHSMYETSLSLDIDAQGRFDQIEMDAKVGAGNLFVSFKPATQDKKRRFRMQTDDAGAFLQAVQVYPNMRGGVMTIHGEAARGMTDRTLVGKAEIQNFKVVHAPVLARLLGLLSLTGVGEILAGDGLQFSKLETNFSWIYRPDGSLLGLKDGRTSGNSIGFLFEGTYDNQEREIDVSGTVVPMSGLNDLIGSIPLVGDILTGGSGGVFAATYQIKGSGDKPEISVNPLSVIAPGIIRRVLFE